MLGRRSLEGYHCTCQSEQSLGSNVEQQLDNLDIFLHDTKKPYDIGGANGARDPWHFPILNEERFLVSQNPQNHDG